MRWFWAVFMVGLLVGPVQAQDNDPRGVISAQVEAFRADDFGAAFAHASPGIQRFFGSVERFEQMVRGGYPMVINPEGMEFLEGAGNDAVRKQEVLFIDSAGERHLLVYRMIRLEGGWRIDGVFLAELPGIAA